jgi:signal transduction histidine kinase
MMTVMAETLPGPGAAARRSAGHAVSDHGLTRARVRGGYCRTVDLTRRLKFRHWVAIDTLAAAAMIAAVVARPPAGAHGVTANAPVGVALVCAAALAVAARRRWPLAALAASTTAQVAATFAAPAFAQDSLLAMALVTYMVARVEPALLARTALLSVLVACTLAAVLTPGSWSVYLSFGSAPVALVRAATSAAFVSAAWATGRAMRSAAAYNERHATATVQEERLRIARELHDVVAHSMSVIAVQAGVGHFVIRDRPEEAEKALAVIETTSRKSLTEMRRLLDMLREERPGDLLPAPGLADLPVLACQTRRAGLEVELIIAGEPRELPVGADLAAFRVVQEALTNVLRHSGTSHCRVSAGYQADGVTITVTDEGTGPYGGEAGHGLAGMRERVTMYGGTFAAGPRPGTGFGVNAWLPL